MFFGGKVKRQNRLKTHMAEDSEDEAPTLTPVDTCFIVCRDVPITVKAQLMLIRYKRGWNSWADMVYDVVREWGDGE